MKKMINCITAALFTLGILPYSAYSGQQVGNGGGAWVCRAQNDSTLWIKLVDSYEAQNDPTMKLTIPQSKDEFMTQLNDFIEKVRNFNPTIAAIYKQELKDVLSRIVPTVQKLTFIDDALTSIEPEKTECIGGTITYEQIANYRHDGVILRRSAIWLDPNFSETDRAGLILHEVIYSLFRKFQHQQNSIDARKLTGYLMSTASTTTYASLLEKSVQSNLPQIPVDREASSEIMAFTFMDFGTNSQVECSPLQTEIDSQIKSLSQAGIDLSGLFIRIEKKVRKHRESRCGPPPVGCAPDPIVYYTYSCELSAVSSQPTFGFVVESKNGNEDFLENWIKAKQKTDPGLLTSSLGCVTEDDCIIRTLSLRSRQ